MKSIFKRLEVLMVEDLDEQPDNGAAGRGDARGGIRDEDEELSSREDPMLSSNTTTNDNKSSDRRMDTMHNIIGNIETFKAPDSSLFAQPDHPAAINHFKVGPKSNL